MMPKDAYTAVPAGRHIHCVSLGDGRQQGQTRSVQMARAKAIPKEVEPRQTTAWGQVKVYLKALGPGLITGASDDDPSGIGTYAQTGAQFGYAQLWTSIVCFPLMTTIQEMCARIALETGEGLAGVLRRHYPRSLLYVCTALLIIANTVNVGADLGAMAAAGELLVRAVPALAGHNSDRHSGTDCVRPLSTLLTGATPAHPVPLCLRGRGIRRPSGLGAALHGTFVPTIGLDQAYLMNVVAILGTTISPYLFFWQGNEEVEEEIADGKTTRKARLGVTRLELKWMRADVAAGMLMSQVVMWFIIATAASTLFRANIHQVDSAARAAEALKPLAGPYAQWLFAAGIIGTGLLAVPVLAGSGAYAVADALKLPQGLDLPWYRAPVFYGLIVLSTLIGAALNLLRINPMSALYYTAVLNGLVAPPLLVTIMLISNNRKIMRGKVNGRWSNLLGWATTGLMSAAAVALVVTLLPGH